MLLARAAFNLAEAKGYSLYLLGGEPGVAAQALNWALRFLVREAIAASVSFFWTWMVVVDVPPVVAFGLDTLSRTEL